MSFFNLASLSCSEACFCQFFGGLGGGDVHLRGGRSGAEFDDLVAKAGFAAVDGITDGFCCA